MRGPSLSCIKPQSEAHPDGELEADRILHAHRDGQGEGIGPAVVGKPRVFDVEAVGGGGGDGILRKTWIRYFQRQ